jgi:hypothetical protein
VNSERFMVTMLKMVTPSHYQTHMT